ncbi:MAG: sigma 54-interacting transcriptional regulator, partial [Candidatus Adiutrix sp.]|nr:sigma 54-interacting transcriptional regulator [Candidatus Adiutrix sp.]
MALKKILVIDDDLSLREMMEMMLRSAGHQVALAEDGLSGLEAARRGSFDVIISDIRMPGATGLEVLKSLRAGGCQTPLILVSAFAKPGTAVEAMHEGAFDFIPKPFKSQDLLVVVDSALAHQSVEQERRALAEAVSSNKRFGRLVGASPAMMHVYDLIKRAAQTPTSILITGESGTGKELVARAVHENSTRSDGEFVAINCGGMPENLVESELFGHKKGSFTGATSDKQGLVAIA